MEFPIVNKLKEELRIFVRLVNHINMTEDFESYIYEQNRLEKEALINRLISYLDLVPENLAPLAIASNANLFFHPWLFLNGKDREGSRIKNPYIGIFHPRGSMHTINRYGGIDSCIINNIRTFNQNIHDGSEMGPMYSDNTANIYINPTTSGIAVAVCIDYPNTLLVRTRVELILSLPDMGNDMDYDENNNKLDQIKLNIDNAQLGSINYNCQNLMMDLLCINQLNPLLRSHDINRLITNQNMINHMIQKYEDELFRLVEDNDRVIIPEMVNQVLNKSNSIMMYDYRAGDESSVVYDLLLQVNIPMTVATMVDIPYYAEILHTLQQYQDVLQSLHLDHVPWEFGICIVRPPRVV